MDELLFTFKSYPIKIFLRNCFPIFQHAKMTISALLKKSKWQFKKKIIILFKSLNILRIKPMQRVQVQSLVRELRFTCLVAKKTNTPKKK